MANPLDYFKNLIPKDTTIFGASPPQYATRAMQLGLLEPDAIKNATKQSNFQGGLNTLLALAGQTYDKGYGSIVPYLAQAYGTGVQAAQNPYTQLGQDMQFQLQMLQLNLEFINLKLIYLQ